MVYMSLTAQLTGTPSSIQDRVLLAGLLNYPVCYKLLANHSYVACKVVLTVNLSPSWCLVVKQYMCMPVDEKETLARKQ